MFDVRCKGTENELGDCSYKTYSACRYYDMAKNKEKNCDLHLEHITLAIS